MVSGVIREQSQNKSVPFSPLYVIIRIYLGSNLARSSLKCGRHCAICKVSTAQFDDAFSIDACPGLCVFTRPGV
jgi:hypothetical protein